VLARLDAGALPGKTLGSLSVSSEKGR